MEVKQIYEIVNETTKEVLGKSDLVANDLSNIVDVGNEVFSGSNVDNYVKTLVDKIGKTVFVNRSYRGVIPSVLMDSVTWGSVIEKISVEIPEAEKNETYDLIDKKSYDVNVFYKPSVNSKYFNKLVTFDIPISFSEKAVKSAFTSSDKLNAFMSMIYDSVDKSMTIKTDSLIMSTIQNMIVETLADEYTLEKDGQTTNGKISDLKTKSGMRAVNVLFLYNHKFSKQLTKETCLTDSDFLKFANLTIQTYRDRMKSISTLFNIGVKSRFTPSEMMRTVTLSDFVNSSKYYLEADTFNSDKISIAYGDVIPYWQGSGEDYSIENVSSITFKHDNLTFDKKDFYILSCVFDRDCLGVYHSNKRITSNYNARAEFFTQWSKWDAHYFNDTNENFVFFFVA